MKIRDLPTKPLQDEALRIVELCQIPSANLDCYINMLTPTIPGEHLNFWMLIFAEEFEEAKKLRPKLWPTSSIRERIDKPHIYVHCDLKFCYLWMNSGWLIAMQSIKDYCMSVNPAEMGYPTRGAAARALHYGSEA